MTQKLTLKAIKKAARDYYDRKRLTAQHPNPGMRECVYDAGEYRCAIGAALNKTVLKAMPSGTVGALVVGGVISFKHDAEFLAAEQIQVAHDEWCDADTPEGRRACKKKFLEAIAA